MDDRISYLIELMESDPKFKFLYVSYDEYNNIVVEGDYFRVIPSIEFNEDTIIVNTYTVEAVFGRNIEFYDTKDALEASDELKEIMSAIADYDGTVLMM